MRNLWTLVDALDEGIANFDGLDFLGELGKELVVNSGLDIDATTSAAGLAVVPAKRRSD